MLSINNKEEHKSIRLKGSPDKMNIPFNINKAAQKRVNWKIGVKPKISIKNKDAESKSIAPNILIINIKID